MKAAVFHKPHNTRMEEVARPKLLTTMIIVGVRVCNIRCSDLHLYKLGCKRMHQCSIIGHEFCGDVVEFGDLVKGMKISDRVGHPPPVLFPLPYMQGQPV